MNNDYIKQINRLTSEKEKSIQEMRATINSKYTHSSGSRYTKTEFDKLRTEIETL
jgi:hypothetical protein